MSCRDLVCPDSKTAAITSIQMRVQAQIQFDMTTMATKQWKPSRHKGTRNRTEMIYPGASLSRPIQKNTGNRDRNRQGFPHQVVRQDRNRRQNQGNVNTKHATQHYRSGPKSQVKTSRQRRTRWPEPRVLKNDHVHWKYIRRQRKWVERSEWRDTYIRSIKIKEYHQQVHKNHQRYQWIHWSQLPNRRSHK